MFNCLKKRSKKIFIHKNNSCEKIITITEDSAIIRKQDYWFKFFVPSHDLIDMDDKLCEILDYRKEEIIGENFQDFLITPILRKFSNVLLEKSEKTIRGMRKIGNQLSEIRFVPLLTKQNNIIWITNFYPIVKFNTFLNKKDMFIIKVMFNIEHNNTIAPNIPSGFMKYLTTPTPTFCVKNFRRCMIIMMDIADSTRIALEKTPTEVALMFHEVIKISNIVIDYEFYPFIRFIEAVGDSLLFWHCPDLSYPLDDIHSECINFALKLTIKLNKFLKSYNTHIRCGISCGECGGGVWDGKTFRLSGKIINLAARLESVCKKDNVVLSETFYNHSCDEYPLFLDAPYITQKTCNLKGFGNINTYNINLNEYLLEDNRNSSYRESFYRISEDDT